MTKHNNNSELLSDGGRAALIVVCSLLLCVAFAVGVYALYKKLRSKRKFEGQYWPALEEDKNARQCLPPLPPPAIEGLI
ncbi:Uncharacterized protein -like protein 3 [Trichinella pseudospiralis]|uniref:Uncharacterized protein-like protein 3 n=1 Tax=Trichinella pseudospiralis TaxID=6337 RepID=A0A0V1EJB1_TRIPS|nr:Uncharacterized protein -like protein 3 [Trichinella pseudospiralis]KRY73538.1 Uncharacterized protein -like protein 3 [Trichinella pseudospiralis]KRY90109.1 Uncharacterized protein -like protein 3 [Trichinella pseudospiralis]KRZ38392.1 Uncharacterized protein -like protein 3 [Trichinella pseudospiralis]